MDGGLNDPAVNVNYLERAVKNVERLNTIVEDLEVISRLESGELVLEMQNFDIHLLANEVFEELEIEAESEISNWASNTAPTSISGSGPTGKASGRY